jgi:uncharacterized protein YneF (UPF0154 family)
MGKQNKWFRKRWLEGRFGHSIYLMYGLTFTNFILIVYRFLIEQDSFFTSVIENLWIFMTIFLVSYIPVSIIIGRWHTQNQLWVENYLKRLEDPLLGSMFRTMLDVQTKKASQKEIEEFRKKLDKIINEST